MRSKCWTAAQPLRVCARVWYPSVQSVFQQDQGVKQSMMCNSIFFMFWFLNETNANDEWMADWNIQTTCQFKTAWTIHGALVRDANPASENSGEELGEFTARCHSIRKFAILFLASVLFRSFKVAQNPSWVSLNLSLWERRRKTKSLEWPHQISDWDFTFQCRWSEIQWMQFAKILKRNLYASLSVRISWSAAQRKREHESVSKGLTSTALSSFAIFHE